MRWRAGCEATKGRSDGCGMEDVVNKEALVCTPKVETGVCKDPSETFARGTSTFVDDWVCRPNPIMVVLCKKDYKENTRSFLEPFNITPMGVNSISPGSPHERPMGRTCGA